jgi:hypothetical protein
MPMPALVFRLAPTRELLWRTAVWTRISWMARCGLSSAAVVVMLEAVVGLLSSDARTMTGAAAVCGGQVAPRRQRHLLFPFLPSCGPLSLHPPLRVPSRSSGLVRRPRPHLRLHLRPHPGACRHPRVVPRARLRPCATRSAVAFAQRRRTGRHWRLCVCWIRSFVSMARAWTRGV